MAPEDLPKLEVSEPHTSTSQWLPNSVHIPYLCLCYQSLGQAFICSQLDPCKSHTANDPCALDSCRDYGISTASSCVPVTPSLGSDHNTFGQNGSSSCHSVLLTYLLLANSFLLVMSQLKCHFLPEVFSNQDSECPSPVIRHGHNTICNCIFIYIYFQLFPP